MPEKNTDATPGKVKPTPDGVMAHSIEIDRLTLENAQVAVRLDAVTKELVEAKEALKKIEADSKAEVVTKLKMSIQQVLRCNDAEREKLCHGKTDEDLSQMLQNFATATKIRKPGDSGIFKPIRTGAVEPHKYGDMTENLTVGNIFGKTRKEIIEMGGKF